MIYAKFNINNNQYTKFTISGHAESGPYGHDLVCSAVSALTIGTANNLSRLANVEPVIDSNEEDGGFLELVLPQIVDESSQHTVQILLASLYHSLCDIEDSYREYLSVSKTNNQYLK